MQDKDIHLPTKSQPPRPPYLKSAKNVKVFLKKKKFIYISFLPKASQEMATDSTWCFSLKYWKEKKEKKNRILFFYLRNLFLHSSRRVQFSLPQICVPEISEQFFSLLFSLWHFDSSAAFIENCFPLPTFQIMSIRLITCKNLPKTMETVRTILVKSLWTLD